MVALIVNQDNWLGYNQLVFSSLKLFAYSLMLWSLKHHVCLGNDFGIPVPIQRFGGGIRILFGRALCHLNYALRAGELEKNASCSFGAIETNSLPHIVSQ